jgi:putative peptidoglycan lipid II flippase
MDSRLREKDRNFMSLFKSAFIVGGGTLLSRIVGYIRDIFIAYALGVGPLADAFFVAQRLPNCFRSLFAEGAFNAAFVPMFSGKLAAEGKEKSVIFASHIFSFMAIFLTLFSILVMAFMPAVTSVLAWGFRGSPEQFNTTVELSRIAFPYLLLVSLVALQSGVLNSLGRFGPPAVTSVLLNICMIIALFTLTNIAGSAAHALAWGMTISGIVQFIWLYFSNCRAGVILKFSIPKMDSDVKTMLKKMVPGIIGSSATQLNIVINTMLATLIPGGVSYLYYSDRLVQFPMAIIGTAMGTALLPLLSRQFKTGTVEDAIKSQNSGLVFAMLFTIPSAFALATISNPLIDFMFARGQFNASDVAATAMALNAYALGLPAFVLIKIFTPGFFANGDTKTPVRIAIASIIFNIIISVALINHLQYVAMALGTSLASILNASLLCWILQKRGLFRFERRVLVQCVRIFASSAIMSALLFAQQQYLQDIFMNRGLAMEAAYIMILITSGILAFFAALRIIGGYKLKDVINMVRKKGQAR